MMTQKLNIYILNDNMEVAGKLRRYLMHRFGGMLKISLFLNSKSCINMLQIVKDHVDLVVVDDYLYDRNAKGTPGLAVLKKIKDSSPTTDVVILTSDDDIGLAIEARKNGAKKYIKNSYGAFDQIQLLIDRTITQPFRYWISEYGVSKFMLIFLATFITMAFVVVFTLKYAFKINLF